MRKTLSAGSLLRASVLLAAIPAVLTFAAQGQYTALSDAGADRAKLLERIQRLGPRERGALEQAFGPDLGPLLGNPRFDLDRFLAGASPPVSPLRDASARPRVTLQDGSPCYYRNQFFTRDVQATIDVQGPGDPPSPAPVDRYGNYDRSATQEAGVHTFTAECGPLRASGTLTMPTSSGVAQIPLVFANRAPILASLVAKVGTTIVSGAPRRSVVTLVANVSDPDGDALRFAWGVNAGSIGTVTGNTAQWTLPDSPGLAFAYVLVTDGKGAFREGSVTVSTDAGVVPAPSAAATATANPSDQVNAADHFLTFFSTRDMIKFFTKGADSRLGSCQYYVAIGAVESCGPAGEMLGTQLDFVRWKAKWGFGSTADFHATYANIRDLDLERDMHGISNNDGTAYYVCNYPHARGGQPDANLLNVRQAENLVACVAMEFSPSPGVSGGRPFTKFLVFGPAGQLLQSVNLDQRGEKFLPGVCVVCHGARADFVRFDEDGSTSPDLGARFLPFDLDNLAYAAGTGPLSRSEQEAQFRSLNLTLLKTNPVPALVELLNLWYPNPATSTFTSTIPPGWTGQETLYKTLVQKYCRTCHVAMSVDARGRDLAFPSVSEFNKFDFELARRACGLSAGIRRARWSMPNAKVTFDQFWNDDAAVSALERYLRDRGQFQGNDNSCTRP
jgi:hypothetical protein